MVSTDQSRRASVPVSWANPAQRAQPEPLWRRAMPLLVWLGCLVAALALLFALGGRLAAPVLTEPSTWAVWAAGRDPVEVTMVVLRLFALGLAWYLVGVTSISVIARVLRAARLVRVADALSVGPVKVLVQQAVGVGLAASVLAAAVPGAAPATRSAGMPAADLSSATIVMAPIGDSADGAPGRRFGHADAVPIRLDAASPAADRETIVPIPVPAPVVTAPPTATPAPVATPAPPAAPAGSAPVATPAPTPAPTAAAAQAPEVDPAADDDHDATLASGEARASGAVREVRIRPGDHFWALAEQEVAAHLRRPGSEAEVVVHWQAIVEANADRLEIPSNPDLLLPGQLVVLPAVGEVLS